MRIVRGPPNSHFGGVHFAFFTAKTEHGEMQRQMRPQPFKNTGRIWPHWPLTGSTQRGSGAGNCEHHEARRSGANARSISRAAA